MYPRTLQELIENVQISGTTHLEINTSTLQILESLKRVQETQKQQHDAEMVKLLEWVKEKLWHTWIAINNDDMGENITWHQRGAEDPITSAQLLELFKAENRKIK